MLYADRASGLRQSKTVNGEKTIHIWDGSNIVMELDGANAVKDSYLRGIGLLNSANKGYYNFNGHGDVVGITDSFGLVMQEYDYDAFGVLKSDNAGDDNPFRYCGEYLDLESGTIYLRNRSYSPAIGRFITEDPVGSGLNWYVYCVNNPVYYIDPFGFDSYILVSIYKDEPDETERNRRQAEIVKSEFEKKYGTPSHIIEISSASEFYKEWNEMGWSYDWDLTPRFTAIDAVQIISHGHVNYKDSSKSDYLIGYLYFSDYSKFYAQENKSMTKNDASIKDTISKKMDYLYFRACNTGNQDFNINIMTAFYNKNPNIPEIEG